MKVKITSSWSHGKCTICGWETRTRLLMQTGGRFRAFCGGCNDWTDFIVHYHDLEWEELEDE